jgi:SAM-dependent methyltransferase
VRVQSAAVETYLSDEFLDRVRRAYHFALDSGARTRGRIWRSIDARRRDVHAALLADGNAALRDIFADPIGTDLYFGSDNLCRSVMKSTDGRPFLELALQSGRAVRARYQVDQVRSALASVKGTSVVEIGPGVGHGAFYAYRDGMTDYATIDLPLGVVAHARFLAEALGPENIWMDGEVEQQKREQIKLFSTARLPPRQFDVALNVDSMTEMPLQAALDYTGWINHHAQLFLSINHELNPFTVAEIALYRIAGGCIARWPLSDRPGYFQESFLIDRRQTPQKSLAWLRAKTLFWNVAVPIRWRLPLLRPTVVPG